MQLRLDSVLFVPVREAPHRAVEDDPGAEVRAELCELAVADDSRFSVSRVELERPGPSYTVDTLRALAEQGDSLVLILGSDQAAALPRWREPEEVLRLAVVAVTEREGADRTRVRGAVAGLRGAERVGFFDMPRIDVSSTMIRERSRLGQPVRYLVSPAVADAIEGRGLYAASTAGAR